MMCYKKSLCVETQAFFFFFVKSQIAGVHQFFYFIIDAFQGLGEVFKSNQFIGWGFFIHVNVKNEFKLFPWEREQ